jgi:tetratricopeptide (TPR) repeat protein
MIKRSDASFGQLYTLATQRTKGDRESLPAAPAAGATARQVQNIGAAYFGYGDYSKAAEFYRAALGMQGADANLINLHLGMALARQGDKAGATAALNAVGGPQTELAKYWLLYASTKA